MLPLQVKVTAPADGDGLPVIVFSHGYEWSMGAYEPLAHRWAEAGFIVIQPTHLDSRRYGIALDGSTFPNIWRARITDLHAIIDSLATVADRVPTLGARAGIDRIAVVGHSWGGQTAGAILGARPFDKNGGPGEDFSRPEVKAGALLSATGTGTGTGTGEDLTPFALRYLSFARPQFATLTVPTLVVASGKDQSAKSTRGPDWFEDTYHRSPSATRLLVLEDAEHLLGGIAGEDVKETTGLLHELVTASSFAASAAGVYTMASNSIGVKRPRWACLRRRWCVRSRSRSQRHC